MTDRTTNSPKSANDAKSVSEQQNDDYEQMQRENKKYTISKRTPDRPVGGADVERSSRSHDGKSTDGQPAGQQHRLGTRRDGSTPRCGSRRTFRLLSASTTC